MLNNNGLWEAKYPFRDLEVGDTIEVTGIEGNIRSAASMWGTRYGIWLQVNKVDDGIMKITRVPAAAEFVKPEKRLSKKRYEQVIERLDAMASLLRLVLERLPKENSSD